MEIPSLPTDNLHKFKAIAGLWLVVLSVIGPGIGLFYISERLIDANRALNTLSARAKLESELTDREFEGLKREQTRYDQEFNVLAGLAADSPGYRERLETLTSSLTELADNLKTLTSRAQERRNLAQAESAIQLVNVESEVERIAFYQNSLLVISVLSVMGTAGGLRLAFFGFREWTRLQQVSDRVLEAELDRLQRHGAPSRAILE